MSSPTSESMLESNDHHSSPSPPPSILLPTHTPQVNPNKRRRVSPTSAMLSSDDPLHPHTFIRTALTLVRTTETLSTDVKPVSSAVHPAALNELLRPNWHDRDHADLLHFFHSDINACHMCLQMCKMTTDSVLCFNTYRSLFLAIVDLFHSALARLPSHPLPPDTASLLIQLALDALKLPYDETFSTDMHFLTRLEDNHPLFQFQQFWAIQQALLLVELVLSWFARFNPVAPDHSAAYLLGILHLNYLNMHVTHSRFVSQQCHQWFFCNALFWTLTGITATSSSDTLLSRCTEAVNVAFILNSTITSHSGSQHSDIEDADIIRDSSAMRNALMDECLGWIHLAHYREPGLANALRQFQHNWGLVLYTKTYMVEESEANVYLYASFQKMRNAAVLARKDDESVLLSAYRNVIFLATTLFDRILGEIKYEEDTSVQLSDLDLSLDESLEVDTSSHGGGHRALLRVAGVVAYMYLLKFSGSSLAPSVDRKMVRDAPKSLRRVAGFCLEHGGVLMDRCRKAQVLLGLADPAPVGDGVEMDGTPVSVAKGKRSNSGTREVLEDDEVQFVHSSESAGFESDDDDELVGSGEESGVATCSETDSDDDGTELMEEMALLLNHHPDVLDREYITQRQAELGTPHVPTDAHKSRAPPRDRG